MSVEQSEKASLNHPHMSTSHSKSTSISGLICSQDVINNLYFIVKDADNIVKMRNTFKSYFH